MQGPSDNFYHGLNNLQAEFFRPVPGSQKSFTVGSVISFFCCLSLVLNFLDLDKALQGFLVCVWQHLSHTQKMLWSMEGTFCHSNKKPFLLYVGMLVPKDVLQFSGTSCALEGMSLKLGAPGSVPSLGIDITSTYNYLHIWQTIIGILKNLFKNPTSAVASIFFPQVFWVCKTGNSLLSK